MQALAAEPQYASGTTLQRATRQPLSRVGVGRVERAWHATHFQPVFIDVGAGRAVVLDYGFWSRSGRGRYKRMIEDAGGRWRVLYFRADLDLLRARVQRETAVTTRML